MISVDLTPVSVRRYSLGVRRLLQLRLLMIGVLGSVGFYVFGLAFVDFDGGFATLDDMKSEVTRLEQEVQQHAEARRVARIDQEKALKRTAQIEMFHEVFDILSSQVPEGLSLSKLRIVPPEAMFEGCARDARSIASLLEAVTTRCPRVGAIVESVQNVAIGQEVVASFEVRLRADVETNAAQWCRTGGLQRD